MYTFLGLWTRHKLLFDPCESFLQSCYSQNLEVIGWTCLSYWSNLSLTMNCERVALALILMKSSKTNSSFFPYLHHAPRDHETNVCIYWYKRALWLDMVSSYIPGEKIAWRPHVSRSGFGTFVSPVANEALANHIFASKYFSP